MDASTGSVSIASVYAALRARIDDFSDLLGNLQPILGATGEAFQAIFRAPRRMVDDAAFESGPADHQATR